MKLLHMPYTYFPDFCGGTEVYVASLCKFLTEWGIDNVIAAPCSGIPTTESHDGIRVHRFATHPALTHGMMYGEGDPVAAAAFAQVLDSEKPDLVHFHTFTPGVSVLCLRETQKRGIPALCTYHTPTNSCVRGTLLRWGDQVCDGFMDATLCAACFLHSHGIPQPLARLAAVTSKALHPLASLPGLPNAARLVLRSASLIKMRHDATREWWSGVRKVIALCAWTEKLLTLNGVPANHIRMVRHGLPNSFATNQDGQIHPTGGPLKLAFLGRLDPTKGVDLLINALKLVPEISVTLDVFGIASPDDAAAQGILAQAKSDKRITIKSPIPASQVVPTLREYDCLLVPSRWLETGPLVVLEAFAAGIPVIGSNLGGIAERIRHEVDGLLVPDASPEAWRDAIVRAATEAGLMPRLRASITTPRTMRDVAAEMREIYLEEIASIAVQ